MRAIFLACLALAAPVSSAPPAAPAARLGAEEVVRKVAAANTALASWSCRFIQRHQFVYLNETETREGRIRLKRGRGLRLDLEGQELETILIEKGRALQWQPRTKQFHVYKIQPDSKRDLSPIPFSFAGGFDPGADHHLRLLEGDGTEIALELLPKESEGASYTRKVLWIDPGTWLPTRLMLTEASTDDLVHIVFREIEVNPKLEDQLFELKPPAGSDVVEHAELPSF